MNRNDKEKMVYVKPRVTFPEPKMSHYERNLQQRVNALLQSNGPKRIWGFMFAIVVK
jgi:hypothetical protein